jgi:hypothetical protein
MRLLTKWVLVCCLLVGPLSADQRFIVRVLNGLQPLTDACLVIGCSVVEGLEDPANQLFLITTSDGPGPELLASELSTVGLVDIEPDLFVTVLASSSTATTALDNSQSASYFGANVPQGYISQPAAEIIQIQKTQATFGVAGVNVVAVIDTGVDPNHPALRNVFVPGYDFTRNQEGYGSETDGIEQSTVAVVDGWPGSVGANQSTVAVVDGWSGQVNALGVGAGQSTTGTLNNSQYRAFGHGTMVAGIVHLVAPRAMIMPLKVFRADGTGYTSDILRATYRATHAGARVINMSFSMPKPSMELHLAVNYATARGTICVSSAGNQGRQTLVYPAAFENVIGVASTTNTDTRSAFSNYGQKLVWVAAPGEGIITTYPFGAYKVTSGTSVSAAFVTGTVALMLEARWDMRYAEVAQAVAHAKPIDADLGNGRLDSFLAVQAARTTQLLAPNICDVGAESSGISSRRECQ